MSTVTESKIIYDFDIFACEYIFDFKLFNSMPLSIGSGKKPFGIIDNPIVRMKRIRNGISKEEPYIPGSSLKGVLRTEAERFVRTIYGDTPDNVCDIFKAANEKDSEKQREREEEKENKDYKPCLICSIFGGQTIASRIKVGNAFLTNYDDKSVSTITKVSINRLTGAAASGKLYDVEYLSPAQEFSWSLRFENIELLGNPSDEHEKKILEIISYLLKIITTKGIEVGGRRSIGYGRLEVKEWYAKRYELLKDGKIKEDNVTESIKDKLLKM
jgi:CRISPR-associated RAMP protein (TIGR02581 family)